LAWFLEGSIASASAADTPHPCDFRAKSNGTRNIFFAPQRRPLIPDATTPKKTRKTYFFRLFVIFKASSLS